MVSHIDTAASQAQNVPVRVPALGQNASITHVFMPGQFSPILRPDTPIQDSDSTISLTSDDDSVNRPFTEEEKVAMKAMYEMKYGATDTLSLNTPNNSDEKINEIGENKKYKTILKINKNNKCTTQKAERHEERLSVRVTRPNVRRISSHEDLKNGGPTIIRNSRDRPKDISKYIPKPLLEKKEKRIAKIRNLRDAKEQRKRMDDVYSDILNSEDFQHQMLGFGNPAVDLNLPEQALRALDKIDQGLKVEHSFSPEIAQELEALRSVFTEFSAKIPNLSALSSSIDDMKDSVGVGLHYIASFTSAIFLVYAGFRARESPSKDTFGVLAVALVAFAFQAGLSVVSSLKEYFQSAYDYITSADDDDKMEPQMGSDGFKSILDLAGIFLHMNVLKNAPEGKTLEKFLALTANFTRSASGIKDIASLVVGFVEKMMNLFLVSICGMNSITLLRDQNEEISGFIDRCKALFDESYRNELSLTVSNGTRVYTLWATGNDLLSRYSGREHFEVRNVLNTHIAPLNKIKIKFEEANILNPSIRSVPLTVCIMGSSGVGKTTAVEPLILALLGGVISKEDATDFRTNHETFIYNRQNEHKYWDGYRGQLVCTFDDFGQLKDVPGVGDNEYMDLIRASNVFTNILHMAGLESKGVTSFRSKFILCTTNLLRFNPDSIIQPDAVNRRFDIVVRHVPPVAYCTEETKNVDDIMMRKLDVTKVKPGFDEDAIEYHFYDLRKDAPTGQVMTFSQLVKTMRELYQRKEYDHAAYKQALIDVKAKYTDHFITDKVIEPPVMECQMGSFYGIRREGDAGFADEDDEEYDFFVGPPPSKYQKWFELLKPDASSTYDAASLKSEDIQPLVARDLKEINACTHRGTFSIGRTIQVLAELFPEIDVAIDKDIAEFAGVRAPELDAFKQKKIPQEGAYMIGRSIHRIKRSTDLLRKYEKAFKLRTGREVNTKIESAYLSGKNYLRMMATKLSDVVKTMPGYAIFERYFVQIFPYAMFIVAPMIYNYLNSIFTSIGRRVFQAFVFFGVFTGKKQIKAYKQMQNGTFKTKAEKKAEKEIVDIPIFEEMGSPGGFRDRNKRDIKYVRAVAARARGQVSKSDAQMGHEDTTLTNIVEKVIASNTYEMWLPGDDRTCRAGFVTFVRGRIAMMPWHFISKMADCLEKYPKLKNTDITLIRTSNADKYKIPYMVFLDEVKLATNFEKLDVCLVRMPDSIHAHKDITAYFHTHASMTKDRDMDVALICPNVRGTQVLFTQGSVLKDHEIGEGDNVFFVQKGYCYRANTRLGDCGSLLALVDSTSREQKFIGIHTGGSERSRAGFSTAVCREDLLEELKAFENETIEEVVEGLEDLTFQSEFGDLSGRFLSIHKSEKALHNPQNTKIIKSCVYGLWGEALTKPAFLKEITTPQGIRVNPMMKGLASYCTENISLNVEAIEIASDGYEQDLRHVSSDFDFRIYTFTEAIMGIQGDADYKAISRQTSPGHPWNLDPNPKYPGKTWWFGHDEDYDLNRAQVEDLRLAVMKIIRDAKLCKRRLFIFSDYLKDETRPIDKVDQGKTRIISACPLDLTIAYRMYFGAFTNWMVKNKIKNGSAVGLNPYSFDWHILAQNLESKGKNVGAGDYSKFDGSEKPIIHWSILEIIQSFYDDGAENARVRRILWEELVNSRHINSDHVYEWFSSLPSGHPLTTMVNVMYNHIAFRYCWYRANGDDKGSLRVFRKNVELCVLGDDNIFSVTQAYKLVFNQVSISEFMLELGLVYTDETKGGELVPFRKLEEVTFLKRGFRVEHIIDRYVAPLELSVILEMPYWTKKSSNRDNITKDKFSDALMELSLHGEEVFNKWAPLMLKGFCKYFQCPELTKRSSLVCKAATEERNW